MALLLCDLDDTLLDRRAIYASWAAEYAADHDGDAVFAEWLIEQDEEGYRPREELWAAVKARLGLRASVDELVAGYRESFVRFMHCTDAVRDALTRVKEAGWAVAIVTNGDAFQQRKVDHAGIGALVDFVCISDLEGFRKPDRRIFEIAAHRCRASLEAAWMIGDNPVADIGGASGCNLGSIWLANGREWPIDLDYQPNQIADSFEAAIDLLLRT